MLLLLAASTLLFLTALSFLLFSFFLFLLVVEVGSLDRVGLVELGPVCEVGVDLVEGGGPRLDGGLQAGRDHQPPLLLHGDCPAATAERHHTLVQGVRGASQVQGGPGPAVYSFRCFACCFACDSCAATIGVLPATYTSTLC